MQFPQFTIGIGAGRVEVAQRHVPDPVRDLNLFQHPFDHELGVPVRVDRVLGGVLRQGQAFGHT